MDSSKAIAARTASRGTSNHFATDTGSSPACTARYRAVAGTPVLSSMGFPNWRSGSRTIRPVGPRGQKRIASFVPYSSFLKKGRTIVSKTYWPRLRSSISVTFFSFVIRVAKIVRPSVSNRCTAKGCGVENCRAAVFAALRIVGNGTPSSRKSLMKCNSISSMKLMVCSRMSKTRATKRSLGLSHRRTFPTGTLRSRDASGIEYNPTPSRAEAFCLIIAIRPIEPIGPSCVQLRDRRSIQRPHPHFTPEIASPALVF